MALIQFVCVLLAVAVQPASSFTPLQPRQTTAPSRTWSSSALFAEANGDITKKKVIVLGGDGFCGWPTSLHLSDQGHDIVIVDNLSRRNIDIELGCDSLTPIQAPEVRELSVSQFCLCLEGFAWTCRYEMPLIECMQFHRHLHPHSSN